MNKLWKIYAWGVLSVISFMFLLFIYWQFFPTKVVTLNNVPYKVNQKIIREGQTLSYTVDYCKYIDSTPVTTRTFVDDVVFVTPSFLGHWEEGCHKVMVSLVIPNELPAGKYYIRIIQDFKVNPIRHVSVEGQTEEFEVIN